MITLHIQRVLTANGATMGVLSGLSRTIYTLEEAWRENTAGISCIPAGTYQCVPHGWEPNTPVKKTKVWEVRGVPNRSAILIHIGNSIKDTEGCILAGMGMQVTQMQSMVSDSTTAIDLMRREIGQNAFVLDIADFPKAA